MDITKHGISIGIERTGDEFFLAFKVMGKLTHEDYQTITPFIDSALASVKAPIINAIVDITELDGWELRAAWDDFKLGLKHGNEFKKVAVFGNKNWQALFSRIASWFIAGDIKFFEQPEDALKWLNS